MFTPAPSPGGGGAVSRLSCGVPDPGPAPGSLVGSRASFLVPVLDPVLGLALQGEDTGNPSPAQVSPERGSLNLRQETCSPVVSHAPVYAPVWLWRNPQPDLSCPAPSLPVEAVCGAGWAQMTELRLRSIRACLCRSPAKSPEHGLGSGSQVPLRGWPAGLCLGLWGMRLGIEKPAQVGRLARTPGQALPMSKPWAVVATWAQPAGEEKGGEEE